MNSKNQPLLPQCPFWLEHQPDPRQIRCEGIIDPCSTALVFQGSQRRHEYAAFMCCNQYRHCKIFAAIMLSRYESGGR